MTKKILQSRLLRGALLVMLILAAINFTLASASATSAGRIDGIGLGVPSNSKPEALDQVMEMGINQVRVEIPWQQVEPEEGDFRWSYGSEEKPTDLDALIKDLDKSGAQVVAVLSGGPAYLEHNWPDQPVDAAELIGRWKVFVQEVVKRYGNRVDVWQIGLEPNRPSKWGKVLFPTSSKASANPNAELYTLMLMEGYRIIKSAGPNDVVLMGALSNPTSTECMQPAGEFLKQVEETGGWSYFDALAMDLFPGENSPEAAWKIKYAKSVKCTNVSKAQNLAGQIRAFQAEAAPFAYKPIWITAVGWRMEWLGAAAEKQKAIPEQIQADYFVRAIVPLLSTSGVEGVISFSKNDPRLGDYELSQLSQRTL
ncbi:MAG: hypothetical protein HGA86_07520, partial [Anaerolineaceae bacterium]|nr:hypothetical protein [Anaerolineaceae bacterium]